MKHIVSRMSSYFPNRWPLSYLNLTKNMKTYIRRQQHKKKFIHQDIKQKEPPQKYRLGSPVLCLAYNKKTRTLRLMVDVKTSTLQGPVTHFLKSQRYTTLYCMQKLNVKLMFDFKSKKDNKCICENVMPCSAFITCVTCLILDATGC